MATKELLYYIPAGQYGKEGVLSLLEQHPEIKFVSLVGIDLAGNDTDEKIPMAAFLMIMKHSLKAVLFKLMVPL